MSTVSSGIVSLLEDLLSQAHAGTLTGLVYCAANVDYGHMIGFEGNLSTTELADAAEGISRVVGRELQDELDLLLGGEGSERVVKGT